MEIPGKETIIVLEISKSFFSRMNVCKLIFHFPILAVKYGTVGKNDETL